MNDFFQSLSFHGGPRPAAMLRGASSAPLRCIMQSFDEVPFTAFRATPGTPRRRSRGSRRRQPNLNLKSEI